MDFPMKWELMKMLLTGLRIILCRLKSPLTGNLKTARMNHDSFPVLKYPALSLPYVFCTLSFTICSFCLSLSLMLMLALPVYEENTLVRYNIFHARLLINHTEMAENICMIFWQQKKKRANRRRCTMITHFLLSI